MKRYIIKTGRFGSFFYDNKIGKSIELSEIEDLLNSKTNMEKGFLEVINKLDSYNSDFHEIMDRLDHISAKIYGGVESK